MSKGIGSLNKISSNSEDKWRAEGDLDTLMRATEIKADAKRLKAAMAIAEERKNVYEKISADKPKK